MTENKNSMKEHRLYTLSEIDEIAAWVIQKIPFGSTCILSGELGAGKTTLVGQIVKLLGGADVSSPTFVLQHIYNVGDHKTVEHWDLYRVGAEPEELCENPPATSLRFIEWGERFQSLQDTASHHIYLRWDAQNESSREIILEDLLVKRATFL